MSDGASLITLLGRVRRRLRLIAAAEAAVVAGTGAAVGIAIWFLSARARHGELGAPAGRAAAALALAAIASGALAGALRRIPLERCARIVDRALDGQDRVLSALAFTRAGTGGAPLPFSTAAIRDALRRAAGVAPARAVPLRRPAGMLDLALGGVVVTLAALVPSPARGSRSPAVAPRAQSPAAARDRGVRIDGGALEAERDEAAAAIRDAAALDDRRLEGLAREMAKTLAALGEGGVPRGEALDRLADLQRRSEEAAREAESLRRELAQAGKALGDGKQTREAGRAIESADPTATEKALSALAERAAQASEPERGRIAAGLDRAGEQARAAAQQARQDGAATPTPTAAASAAAAASLAAAAAKGADGPEKGDDKNTPEERQRRLARDGERPASNEPSPGGAPAGGNHERRLEHLDDNLSEAAAACRANPEACRRQLDQAAKDLPRMERQANSAESRRRLAQAVRQLRERLRREGPEAGERRKAEQRFMREARGETATEAESIAGGDVEVGTPGGSSDKDPSGGGQAGDRGQGSGAGAPSAGDPRPQGNQEAGEGAGAGAGREPAQGGSGAADPSASGAETSAGAPGNGIGNQRGGDPLGAPGALGARGHAEEARVAGSARGPGRSQVIQSAARRGFAHVGYGSVFRDYRAAVEESLDTDDVPPGRRYVVRRYFQLIRPVGSPAPSPPPLPAPSRVSR